MLNHLFPIQRLSNKALPLGDNKMSYFVFLFLDKREARCAINYVLLYPRVSLRHIRDKVVYRTTGNIFCSKLNDIYNVETHLRVNAIV